MSRSVAVARPAGGVPRHIHEAQPNQRRRTPGHPAHAAIPDDHPPKE